MKTMAAELNATFSLYKRKDGIWGSLKNGSWSGMLQNLVNGNAALILKMMLHTAWSGRDFRSSCLVCPHPLEGSILPTAP